MESDFKSKHKEEPTKATISDIVNMIGDFTLTDRKIWNILRRLRELLGTLVNKHKNVYNVSC